MTARHYIAPAMPSRDHARWAKEMILASIDERLDGHEDYWGWDMDDHRALLRERNRVARFLGLPERTHSFRAERPGLSVEEHNRMHDAALRRARHAPDKP